MDKEKILYLFTAIASKMLNAGKPTKPKKVERILALKLDEIGDMVYTMHCFSALKKVFPDAHLSVVCKPMNNDLVKQTGVVDDIINDLKTVEGKFDVQIDFRGNWASVKRAILGGCYYYLERGSIRLHNKIGGAQTHEIITNQNIIKPLFPKGFIFDKPRFNVEKKDIEFIDDLLNKLQLQKFVLMHCGARDAERRWPTDRFALLVNKIFEKYGLKTIFIGSKNESELVETVLKETPHGINLAGQTSLMQLAALTRKCTFYVGNESGPLHFAIIEQKPLVALFGPGVKDVFYPIYPNQHVIHHLKPGQIKGDNDSILQISVEEVYACIDSIF
ncbi:MAG: glycosyltransferase family 9 protein [Flavobacteriales bacterium]|nr:glycosyltransferase family 9 protein [Flavobacteriales bacterium]